MSLITDARDHVATALANLDVNVYTIAPQAGLTPPCVVITASQNWVDRITLKQFNVHFDLEVTAQPAGTNEAAMQRLEDLVAEIIAIFPINGSVQAPTSQKVGQADLLTSIVPVSVQVTE